MASVKTKQNQKSDDTFEKPTFQYIQLCCLVQKDSTTPKVLKLTFVSVKHDSEFQIFDSRCLAVQKNYKITYGGGH